jgi:hypothetical protein
MTYNNHHKHAKKQNENIAYFLKTSKAEIITKVTRERASSWVG